MASNKATLVGIFSQGDVPQGTDFANLINSNVNMAETALQSMLGPLQAIKLAAPLVSAAAINTTSLNITNVNVSTINATTASATTMNAANISATLSLSTTCDVSAPANNVYCSGTRYSAPIIVSAVGTAQATGAPLTATICRLQGITDGQTTGFSLLANRTGWIQYLLLESATSANLWPPTGGKINNLSTNTVFPLTGGVAYTVFHTQASAYGVK